MADNVVLKTQKEMRKKVFYVAVATLMLFACTNEGLEDIASTPSETVTSYKVTPEEAQDIVQGLVEEMECNALTRGLKVEIANVDVLRRSAIQTRIGETETPIGLDTLMYVVNFANDNGFALVAADKRTEPIFALVDEGNFNFDQLEKEENDMFLTFIDDAIYMELEDIKNFKGDNVLTKATSKDWTINTQYAPILKTKWGQGDKEKDPNSYGKYCPNKVAGCTVIAAAQILSHYQTPGHVNWSYNGSGGSADLHWTQIISDCEKYGGKLTSPAAAQSLNEVAHLCRYLGIAIGVDYKSKGETSGKSSKVVDWFNDWSGLKASKLKEYDANKIITAIKNGTPVYAGGYSKKKKFLGITTKRYGGHAWVYDGYISATKDGERKDLIHCNWGWNGLRDGYYISKVFNTNNDAEIKDYELTRNGTEYYYQFKLEYSVISR